MKLPPIITLLAWLSRALADASESTPREPPMVLGMSTALTGPLAPVGEEIKRGVELAIEEVNREGGVPNLPWKLVAVDDGYDPTRTAANMRSLIEEHRVMAVVGNLGTPTAAVALPIATETRTLFYAPVTGASMLRQIPSNRYVIHLRAGYREEIHAMVDALMRYVGVGVEQIGFLTQRDAYGDDGFAVGLEELARRGVAGAGEVLHLRYERNTTAVEGAVARLLAQRRRPRAMILVATHAAGAKFVRLVRERGLDTCFLAVSFLGSEAFANSIGSGIDRVLVTQVVPHPTGEEPAARRFREALEASAPGVPVTCVAFEGFIMVRVLARALRGVQGPLDRERVVDALESLGSFELSTHLKMRLTPGEHQASGGVWPTLLRDGKFVPCDWGDLKEWRLPGT
ncbi:MAG: ABC transporter substrate-binding protein [Verrucomicrobiales bacterium]|nr:ABC transporter substrate-binding protein [Verrucomicrobiales bacterium]